MSFQLLTTSSQVKSVLSLYNVGRIGFLLPSRNPLYLKLTISPIFGFHRLTNSVVPAGAKNFTPFGLIAVVERGDEKRVSNILGCKRKGGGEVVTYKILSH